MNAASAPVPNSKAAEQRAHEPSMEEILASIRKIIADDQVFPLSARQPSEADRDNQPNEEAEARWDEASARPEADAGSKSSVRSEPARPAESSTERTSLRSEETNRAPEPFNRAAEAPNRSLDAPSRAPEAPAPRQPVNFHSGLASIFSNERPSVRPEAADTAPRAAPPTPQLVAKSITPLREAPAAVVLPIDGERARPVQNDVWAESRKVQQPAIQDNRPLQAPEPDDYDVVAPVQRRETSSGAPSFRDASGEQRDLAARRRSDQGGAAQMRPEARRPEPVQRQPEPDSNQRRDMGDRLLSEHADASIASAFQSLATTLSLPEPEALESMTRELLRPMLKQWLDDNLPVMVEKLVRAEIERVARGPR